MASILCRITVATVVAGVILLATPAHAQSATDAPPDPATASSSPVLKEIVVTGSRVITAASNSPSPIMQVQTNSLMSLQPTTLADALNDLPVFSGSKTQGGNPISTGIFGQGNPGADVLNLRNLGLTDTLVLLDGQRLVPTLLLGAIDVDMIPSMLIKRVDVVTGGGSAVYGSDAVAGVVNYVTDDNFNGVKVLTQGGISQDGDDNDFKWGIAGGMPLFDGRVHIEGSFERYSDAGILQVTDRPANALWGVPGAGTAPAPYTLTSDLRNSNATFGGLITSGALKGYTFQSNGIPTPFVNGTSTGSPGVQVGGDGYYSDPSLIAPEYMNQGFGRVDVDITNTLHGYLQATYDDKYDFENGGGFAIQNDTLSSSNPFLSPALQAELSAGGSTFKYSKEFPLSELPPIVTTSEEQQTEINTGLTGDLGKYNWAVNLNYGRAALYDVLFNNINLQHLGAALDSTIDPATGAVVCAVTLTNPKADPGCAPLNPFGPSAASEAAIKYIEGDTAFTSVYALYDTTAHISGNLFNTWAGPVASALSAEWRQLTFTSSTDAPPTVDQDCAGIPYNCNPTAVLWESTFPASPLIHQTVSEAALEFNVPLLRHEFLAQALNLDLAARAVNYSQIGNAYPFKSGLVWRVADGFTLRGTYSRDISAPTVYELYQPPSILHNNEPDLLTGLTYIAPSVNLGNPNLKPQVAYTKTVGFLWQPPGTGFSVSLDYFNISITDAIEQVDPYQNQYQEACYSSGGTSPYCSLIIRPSYTSTSPTNLVTEWITQFYNIATEQTTGEDLDTSYIGALFGHRFELRLLGTYQPHLYLTQAGNSTYDVAGTINGPTPYTDVPSLAMTGWVTAMVTKQLSVQLTERWRSQLRATGELTGDNDFSPSHIPSVGFTDANVDYTLGSEPVIDLYLNVEDLFNTLPPPATFTQNQTGPGAGYVASDDVIGRYFTVGVRASF